MTKEFNIYFLKLLIIIFVIYFLILTTLYFFQRNLLYNPLDNNYSGDDLIVKVNKITIKTSDGIELLGWFHKKDLKKI